MNEDQRKWLLDLQSKGIKFENVSVNGNIWYEGPWEFKNDRKDYRIPAQSIPDIPDWRELYIQYLEDALNHAKTGEPMKCWQVKIRNQHGWLNVSEYALLPESIHEEVQLRIKPEPFKWTAYACWYYINSTRYVYFDTVKGHHVSAEDLQRRFPDVNIIAVHHHEVNVDD